MGQGVGYTATNMLLFPPEGGFLWKYIFPLVIVLSSLLFLFLTPPAHPVPSNPSIPLALL